MSDISCLIHFISPRCFPFLYLLPSFLFLPFHFFLSSHPPVKNGLLSSPPLSCRPSDAKDGKEGEGESEEGKCKARVGCYSLTHSPTPSLPQTSIHLPIYLSIYLPIYLSIYLSIHLSIHPSTPIATPSVRHITSHHITSIR